MTALVATERRALPDGRPAIAVRLQAPRANALEPGVLAALSAALDAAEADPAEILLLCAAGRNFCSGGDVARFRAAAERGEAEAYADAVVPALQAIIARLIALPKVVAVAARGAITGGGAGFLFAADTAVLTSDAFVQPFYGRVGFAPDGGWTALLPDRIGAGPARDWLVTDRRTHAADLVALGLATGLSDTPEETVLDGLSDLDTGALIAAKALIWDTDRQDRIGARLRAETAAFRDRIARPDTAARMADFLSA